MLAHLYRGEMYRSKVWRTRLDATTNWAVVTTGVAISVTFSNAENSPLPLVLVVLLDLVFLAIEARRYRYFDIWAHPRANDGEVPCTDPSFSGSKGFGLTTAPSRRWLSTTSTFTSTSTFWEAMGRRLRRNYSFLFLIQGVSYAAKICIHPTGVRSFDQLWERAAIGPIPGEVVLIIGFLFHASLIVLALLTLKGQLAAGRGNGALAPSDLPAAAPSRQLCA